jgi:hypothetical protein
MPRDAVSGWSLRGVLALIASKHATVMGGTYIVLTVTWSASTTSRTAPAASTWMRPDGSPRCTRRAWRPGSAVPDCRAASGSCRGTASRAGDLFRPGPDQPLAGQARHDGIPFSPSGAAQGSRRVSHDDIATTLAGADRTEAERRQTRRAWLVRGSAVQGGNFVPRRQSEGSVPSPPPGLISSRRT